MIFFQSLVTNSVSDFSVGSGDVTSAMCDEAFSGPVFAPWAGAIRRRMNIVSAIPRPKYQRKFYYYYYYYYSTCTCITTTSMCLSFKLYYILWSTVLHCTIHLTNIIYI